MELSILMVVALTIFGEAAGESLSGKLAVASVIWNRARGRTDRFERECRRPRQFSCWNSGQAPTVPKDPLSRAAFSDCLLIAQLMIDHTFNPTIAADHYYALSMRQAPRWAREMTVVEDIGGHRFLNSRNSQN